MYFFDLTCLSRRSWTLRRAPRTSSGGSGQSAPSDRPSSWCTAWWTCAWRAPWLLASVQPQQTGGQFGEDVVGSLVKKASESPSSKSEDLFWIHTDRFLWSNLHLCLSTDTSWMQWKWMHVSRDKVQEIGDCQIRLRLPLCGNKSDINYISLNISVD